MSGPRLNLYDLTREELRLQFVRWGFAPVHAARLWSHLYLDLADSFSAVAMPDLPAKVRARLEAETHLGLPAVALATDSSDGFTRKYLLRLADGERIETVLMRFTGRVTACVSSQVGCAMGCVFCATGQMGYLRHLTPGEIVAQAVHVARALRAPARSALHGLRENPGAAAGPGPIPRGTLPAAPAAPPGGTRHVLRDESAGAGDEPGCHVIRDKPAGREREPGGGGAGEPAGERLRNVVLMGMGEPLHNYDAVMQAVDILRDPCGLALGAERITLSTVGVVPGILRLARERRPVHLAVSLHAATQAERAALVPAARKWPLDELMAACRTYSETTGRRIFYEWTLIAGKNDTPGDARAVGALLRGRPAQVNLIPLNPTEGYNGAPTHLEAARRFQSILADEFGLPCTVRQRRGIDIAAGCGQLAVAAT